MGTDHRIGPGLGLLALVVLVLSGTAGCKKRVPAPAPMASASAKPPIDRLAPGELSPGTETMFGLLLPRGMRVAAQFPGIAHATGRLHPEDVANYIRDRVDVHRVELGVVGTVFSTVHVLGGDPTRLYRIEVNSAADTTEVIMRDVTPVPKQADDPSMSNAEKWRRAGYKPNGTPLDPMHAR